MKFFLIISFLLTSLSSYACMCGIYKNKEGAEKLKSQMDYIIEGTVIEVVDELYDEYCSSENVRIRVDRVINGPMDLKEIITNQVSSGNCAASFTIGEKYIIAGRPMFRGNKEKNKTKIPLSIKNSIVNGVDFCRKQTTNSIELWNCLSKTNTVVYTDGCLIYEPQNKFYNYF